MQKIQLGGQNAPRFKAACDDVCDDGTHLFPLFPWIEFRGILEFYTCKKEGLCWFAVCIIEQELQLRGQNVAYDDETQSHISKEVLVDWLPLSRGNREAHFESCLEKLNRTFRIFSETSGIHLFIIPTTSFPQSCFFFSIFTFSGISGRLCRRWVSPCRFWS